MRFLESNYVFAEEVAEIRSNVVVQSMAEFVCGKAGMTDDLTPKVSNPCDVLHLLDMSLSLHAHFSGSIILEIQSMSKSMIDGSFIIIWTMNWIR